MNIYKETNYTNDEGDKVLVMEPVSEVPFDPAVLTNPKPVIYLTSLILVSAVSGAQEIFFPIEGATSIESAFELMPDLKAKKKAEIDAELSKRSMEKKLMLPPSASQSRLGNSIIQG